MGLLEGKMASRSRQRTVSTGLERIAKLAKEAPSMVLTTLAHHIDIEWLHEAYRRTRKSGATGVDGQTASEYAEKLESNLESLLDRAKSGHYRAPAVKRVHIPKGSGKETRPIGIPTIEDKILQRAVTMVLNAVYEQDFMEFSFGFRPNRSPHQALEYLRDNLMSMHGGWALEVDIRKFFDTVDHAHIRSILRERVCDGVLLRLIGKWLKAGVLEDGNLTYPESGTPQGGVISPLLANIYLHTILDKWFVEQVQPCLRGRSFMVRFADDFVMVFEYEEDAHRVREAIVKRLARFELAIHPDKTRLVRFGRPPKTQQPPRDRDSEPGSFDFLGFTHYWGRSRKGNWVVKKKTSKKRLARTVKRLEFWCRQNRHRSLREQQTALNLKLRGHYNYFGVTGNIRSLEQVYWAVTRVWRKWLSRRSQKAKSSWQWFHRMLEHYSLLRPFVRHSAMPRMAKP